jgi:hypothetical protein
VLPVANPKRDRNAATRPAGFSRSTESLGEPGEHRQVGVKLNPGEATNAERGKAVAVLQISEAPLNGDTAPIKALEPLGVAGDAREQSPAEGERERYLVGLCATEWDHRFAAALLNFSVDPGVVITLVAGDRLGLEPASVKGVEERGDELGFVVAGGLDAPGERKSCSRADGGLDFGPEPARTARWSKRPICGDFRRNRLL